MTDVNRTSIGGGWATATRAYQLLFFTLLFSGVLLVAFDGVPLLRAAAEIFTGLVLISAALVASLGTRRFVLILGFGAVMFVSHVANVLFDLGEFEVVARGLIVAFILVLTVVLARDVFIRRETVDAQVVYGAMSLYLLIGLTFGFAYAVSELLDAGSIKGLGDTNGGLFEFFYFSIVTLTTLGYGDMSPVTPATRGLVMVEALLGQIYLAVAIARVVSMYGRNRTME